MAVPHSTLELTARGRVIATLCVCSLLGALLTGDANVRLAAGMLLAPLLVDFFGTPRALGRAMLMLRPRRTVVGATFHETVQVQNQGRAPLREVLVCEVQVREVLGRERRTRTAPALVGAVAPGDRCEVLLWCTSVQRSHQLERVFELQSDWPLGLFRRCSTAVVATDLVTEPRRVPLPAELLTGADERERAPHTHSRLPGEEFHALREHQPLEDARGVHALRSAAHGELLRTVVRGRLPQRTAIVLDLRRPPGRVPHHGSPRFEWSLGATAVLLDRLRTVDCTVHLFALGTTTERMVVRSGNDQREALTFLAEASPTPHRELEAAVVEEARAFDECFWIPAGGWLLPRETARLQPRIIDGGHE